MLFEYYEEFKGRKAMIENVKILIEAAPAVVNFEDIHGKTALEYAIESDIDLSVILCIQIASEKDWKVRRANAHSHKCVERSIQKCLLTCPRSL